MSDPNPIQSVKPEPVLINTERLVIAPRSPVVSKDLNKFFESVLSDLVSLSRQGNVTASAIVQRFHTLQQETDSSRQMALGLKKEIGFLQKTLALQGRRVGLWYDLHDGSDISFVPGSDISKRASVSTQFGQATIPMNAVESKTFATKILSSAGVVPVETVAAVSGIFDKQLGDGPLNYEGGDETPTIEQTDLMNMTNGNNQEYWRRRAIFNLESDVSEVECEVEIQMPPQASLDANVVYIHPYPLGQVDITGVWISPDLDGSYTAVSGFEELRGAKKTRWFFETQKVAKVRLRLRQRNWSEESGRKVFEYGLQEVGVQLVEWDTHYDAEASTLTDNHAFVTTVRAQPGLLFGYLHGFYSAPDYLLESPGARHLHFVISRDASGAQPIWNSDQSAAPQSLQPIDLGAAEVLYVITTMNWCADVAVGSPFRAGTPPFINGFGLDVRFVEGS